MQTPPPMFYSLQFLVKNMGFLSRLFNPSQTPPGPSNAQLEQKIEALESKIKLLAVEWDEVYDKITRAADRVRQRTRKLQELVPENEPKTNENPATMDQVELTRFARKRGIL